MSIKPILFSTPMVQAIQNGRKTMTRRVITPQTVTHSTGNGLTTESLDEFMRRNLKDVELLCKACAPYQPGDILWVRETFAPVYYNPVTDVTPSYYAYRTDYGSTEDDTFPPSMHKWRPSIHMPKEAARLFLRVTDVRVERVQEISDEDAIREGIVFTDFGMDANRGKISIDGGLTFHDLKPEKHAGYHTGNATTPGQCMHSARGAFISLWDTLNAKRGYGWDANPWVWVYTFERAERPAGWPGGEVSE